MLLSTRTRWLACWLLGALAFAGCGAETDPAGDLSIELELANGTEIDEVSYSISGNGMPAMGGTINTSAPGSTASVEVYGIPAGEDYTVEMTATSTDGETSCSGSAEFDVAVTSLALLAFLGDGQTHLVGPRHEQVQRGLEWLCEQQDKDGLVGAKQGHAYLYGHGPTESAERHGYRR